MQNFSLYIDHQSIAPLIRELETIVQTANQQVAQSYEKHQIRMAIYQQFIRQIHDMYAQTHPEVKLQENLIKIEDILQIRGDLKNDKDEQMLNNNSQTKNRGRKSRGPTAKSLEIQVKLVEWLISCDKIMFQKREIDEKYQELLQNSKRSLHLNKIKELVIKYNINALIVKTRGGQQHFFARETQNTQSTVIKKQQQESINIQKWIEDDQQTINPTRLIEIQRQQDINIKNELIKSEKIIKQAGDQRTVMKILMEECSNEFFYKQDN